MKIKNSQKPPAQITRQRGDTPELRKKSNQKVKNVARRIDGDHITNLPGCKKPGDRNTSLSGRFSVRKTQRFTETARQELTGLNSSSSTMTIPPATPPSPAIPSPSTAGNLDKNQHAAQSSSWTSGDGDKNLSIETLMLGLLS